MKSTFAVTLPAMAAVCAFANTHAELHHIRAPMPAESGMPRTGTITLQGCFSSVGNMTKMDIDTTYLSSGKCADACKPKHLPAAAIGPQECYCGFVYPPTDSELSSGDCNYKCNGFPSDMCGGVKNAYSVYNLGVIISLDNYVDPSASSSSASATASSTGPAPSSSHTASQSPNAESGNPGKASGGGPNTAAIAAGVVVGVVVAAGIIGAILFFIRRKRNAEIEEDHRRNANLNAFISGSKPPSTSGGISITDSRLDPVMAHRRLSDGSIADNQDYSRKILRVTNA